MNAQDWWWVADGLLAVLTASGLVAFLAGWRIKLGSKATYDYYRRRYWESLHPGCDWDAWQEYWNS